MVPLVVAEPKVKPSKTLRHYPGPHASDPYYANLPMNKAFIKSTRGMESYDKDNHLYFMNRRISLWTEHSLVSAHCGLGADSDDRKQNPVVRLAATIRNTSIAPVDINKLLDLDDHLFDLLPPSASITLQLMIIKRRKCSAKKSRRVNLVYAHVQHPSRWIRSKQSWRNQKFSGGMHFNANCEVVNYMVHYTSSTHVRMQPSSREVVASVIQYVESAHLPGAAAYFSHDSAVVLLAGVEYLGEDLDAIPGRLFRNSSAIPRYPTLPSQPQSIQGLDASYERLGGKDDDQSADEDYDELNNRINDRGDAIDAEGNVIVVVYPDEDHPEDDIDMKDADEIAKLLDGASNRIEGWMHSKMAERLVLGVSRSANNREVVKMRINVGNTSGAVIDFTSTLLDTDQHRGFKWKIDDTRRHVIELSLRNVYKTMKIEDQPRVSTDIVSVVIDDVAIECKAAWGDLNVFDELARIGLTIECINVLYASNSKDRASRLLPREVIAARNAAVNEFTEVLTSTQRRSRGWDAMDVCIWSAQVEHLKLSEGNNCSPLCKMYSVERRDEVINSNDEPNDERDAIDPDTGSDDDDNNIDEDNDNGNDEDEDEDMQAPPAASSSSSSSSSSFVTPPRPLRRH